jgi:hypothetical protein
MPWEAKRRLLCAESSYNQIKERKIMKSRTTEINEPNLVPPWEWSPESRLRTLIRDKRRILAFLDDRWSRDLLDELERLNQEISETKQRLGKFAQYGPEIDAAAIGCGPTDCRGVAGVRR